MNHFFVTFAFLFRKDKNINCPYMMNKLMKLFLIAIFMVSVTNIHAQVVNPVMVQSELSKHGLTEDEVRAKLLEKGIDIDHVSPDQLSGLEGQIKAAIAELEAEKNIESEATKGLIEEKAKERANVIVEKEIKNLSTDVAETVQKAVDSGESIDAAISEEILDEKNNSIPNSTIYGHHIFRNKSIKVFNQATDVRAPDTYELGPKDMINVSIWGYSELSKSYEVTIDGYIKPDRMAPIFVKGITLGDAKKLLRKAFSRYYNFKADEFDVNLNYSRTITINISGEAIRPGSYTLPAINTAFNALVASGGPSDIGSVREIMLIRAGKKPVKLDVYAFLANPNVAQNAYLQDGDYIHIPVSKKIVAISGAILKPFRYELTSGENLSDLIQYAGGFKANAYNSKIQIKRFQGQEEKLIDVDFAKARKYALLNGDNVKVFSIPQRYENFVEISGEVALPGEYEIEKAWRITDLISKGKLLRTSKRDFAFLQRKNPDGTYQLKRIDLEKALENNSSAANILLLPMDKLIVYAQSQFVDNAKISITGSVRKSIELPFDGSRKFKVEDLIQMANGLSPKATDFAFIYRKSDENSVNLEYVLVDLKEAISNPNSPANIVLEPNDRLYVPSNDSYLDGAHVLISGAVRKPGSYTYDVSLTMNKLLLMSDGLKMSADRNRIEIFRIDMSESPIKTRKIEVNINDNGQVVEDVVLLPYDQIRVRSLSNFEFQKNVTINGEVAFPGVYAITDDNEKILDLLNKAGGITNEAFLAGATLYRQLDNVGYIIIRLDDVYKNKNSTFNMVLAKGDIITIPKMQDFVSIEGATNIDKQVNMNIIGGNKKINAPFHNGRRANFYVSEYAGGTSEYGRKRLISVRYPNGQLKETKNFGLFKIYPKVTKGASIHVGEIAMKDRKKVDKDKEAVDWSKLLGDTIAQATTIITLLLLVQRIN